MSLIKRLLREPLLHFLVIGGLFFAAFGVISKPAPAPVDTIVVGPDQIEQLKVGFESVWRRQPSDDERRALIDDLVREEVYYREALALGLDRNDTVVRRRLRQKMEFLADSGADLLAPTDSELEAFFAANETTYRSSPGLSFEQIFLGERPAPEEVSRVLAALQSDPANPFALGKPTLLPAQLGLSTPEAIDGAFGKNFFEALTSLPVGEWAGPVSSGFGAHVVRVLESVPGQAPPLQDVRAAVLRDWKAAKVLEIRELQYGRLRHRYVIEIKDADTPPAENR